MHDRIGNEFAIHGGQVLFLSKKVYAARSTEPIAPGRYLSRMTGDSRSNSSSFNRPQGTSEHERHD